MGSKHDLFNNPSPRVFKNRDVLRESYTPDEIQEREDKIERYENILSPAVHGDCPANVIALGDTGVGKTAVTDFVLDALEMSAEQNDVGLRVIKQDCSDKTGYKTAVGLANSVCDFPSQGLALSDALERFLSELDGTADIAIVVLDEIDHPNDIDPVLYKLTRAEAHDHLEETKLAVIGTSNELDFRHTLSPKTQDTLQEQELYFGPYDAHELRSILNSRVEKAFYEDTVTQGSIARCAALAAQDEGNARQALDIIWKAGDEAVAAGDEQITESHVEEAKVRVERGHVESKISKLTEQRKIVLESVARECAASEGDVQAKDVFERYKDVMDRYTVTPVSTTRSIKNHLNSLAMMSFITKRQRNNNQAGGSFNVYELEMEPETIVDTIYDLRD
jgi:orc1/cdc6 family replication initiation protein